jgi:hypothetical protein
MRSGSCLRRSRLSLSDVRSHQVRQDALIRRIDAAHRRLADDVASIAERAQSRAQASMAAKQIRRRIERTERQIASDIRLHVSREIRYGIRVAVRERGITTTLGQVDRLRGSVAMEMSREYGATATQLVKQYANQTATDVGRYVRANAGRVNGAEVKLMLRSRNRPYLPENAPGVATPRSLDASVRRIISGEGNRGFRKGADRYAEAGGAIGVRWRLNASHPEPDPCDTLASQDLYGLGAGVYPPGQLPEQPHPHCRCWAETIWAPTEEAA